MKPPLFFTGSLPFTDAHRALQFVKEFGSTLPFLPQLPRANPKETMAAQVIRGMQVGEWNNEISCCFSSFLSEFQKVDRFKIQMAGPFTTAWFSSKTYAATEATWNKMWDGVRKQIDRSGFKGEIWLQIDEPIWSIPRPLPVAYPAFLESLVRDPRVRIGLHCCSSERPLPDRNWMDKVSFFSFDYLRTHMTPEEKLLWRPWLGKDRILAIGIIDRIRGPQWKQTFESIPDDGSVWMSPSCGLFEWSDEDIERLTKSGYSVREMKKSRES